MRRRNRGAAKDQVESEAAPLSLQDEHPLLQVVVIGFVFDVADTKVVSFDNREDVDEGTSFGFGWVIFEFPYRYFYVFLYEAVAQNFDAPGLSGRRLAGFGLQNDGVHFLSLPCS